MTIASQKYKGRIEASRSYIKRKEDRFAGRQIPTAVQRLIDSELIQINQFLRRRAMIDNRS